MQPRALGLEALEDALSHLDLLVVGLLRRTDPGAEEVGRGRFDVLDDQPELLEAAIRTRGRLVELGVGTAGQRPPPRVAGLPPEFALLAATAGGQPQRVGLGAGPRVGIVAESRAGGW